MKFKYYVKIFGDERPKLIRNMNDIRITKNLAVGFFFFQNSYLFFNSAVAHNIFRQWNNSVKSGRFVSFIVT